MPGNSRAASPLSAPAGSVPGLALLLAAAFGSGCIEQEFTAQPFDSIAVVAGDFDYMEAPLDRMVVGYQRYEGFICCASYDSSINPDNIALKTETLFAGLNDKGASNMLGHDALFLNSGARGFGEFQYNGVEADDELISNPDVVAHTLDFVNRGRTLVASDWTYDLVEATWPDAVEFYGDDAALDAAQAGAPGRITANVVDEGLANDLGQETLSLVFNYSNWTVMEDVGADTKVLLRGDVEYRVSDAEGFATLENVPLLVTFESGNGTVILSSFHWNAQNPAVVDTMMLALIGGLRPGSADDVIEEDTGATE